MTEKPIVIIESPFAADNKEDLIANVKYTREAMRNSLKRGEAPFASHALYTLPGVLDDNDPKEREQGMEAGFAFQRVASFVAVYIDKGISPGMKQGIEKAKQLGLPIEYRVIHTN